MPVDTRGPPFDPRTAPTLRTRPVSERVPNNGGKPCPGGFGLVPVS